MRFGRILLAVLAPLLSVSPALKAPLDIDVTPESHAPAVDSLLNLLRSVVPAAISNADAASHATAHAPHFAGFASRPFLAPNLTPHLSPAAAANLHLIERLHFRFLLRC
jgi:hypothetical protein